MIVIARRVCRQAGELSRARPVRRTAVGRMVRRRSFSEVETIAFSNAAGIERKQASQPSEELGEY